MQLPSRHLVFAAGFALILLVLIALATGGVANSFFLVMLVMVLGAVAMFYLIFPGSHFFTIALADFLAVYVCLFVFFVEANFEPVSTLAVQLGFCLPIVAFLVSVWWRRDTIRRIVMSRRLREEGRFGRVLLWLLPIFGIGALTFMIPGYGLGPVAHDVVFLSTMVAISAIVIVVSRSVCIFLLDTGLLFEEFFNEVSRLIVPAIAFLAFYSLIIIVFACIYRIIDHYSGGVVHFDLYGEWHKLSFSESLYFSIITLSTVGYGDIEPVSDLVRVIVAIQIVFGVLLLLFGFSEILRYAREREETGPPKEGG